jgi:hypothetical protein
MLTISQERAIVRVKTKNDGFLGTAFFIAPQLALTCSHVFKSFPASEVRLVGALSGGTPTHIAEVVLHEKIDLAVVKTTYPDRSQDYLATENIWPTTGQQMHACGYAGSLELLEPRPFEVVGTAKNGMYKLHGVVPGGFSGGPVLDAKKRVIGIACLAGDSQNLTYFIPLAEVVDFVESHLPIPASKAFAVPERSFRRSLKSGLSTALGSIHLHVDGGRNLEIAERIIQFTDPEGDDSEITEIQDFKPGPQRKDLPKLYSEHTPTEEGEEKLEFFSTTILHIGPSDPDTRQLSEIEDRTRNVLGLLNLQLAEEGAKPGSVVVEVERVVGTVDHNNECRWFSTTPLSSAFDATFLYVKQGQSNRGRTLFEVHFAVDLQRVPGQERPPLGLEDLLDACARAKLSVGGWFLFASEAKWSFRSNSFEYGFSREAAKKYQTLLLFELSRLEHLDANAPKVRVLVEEVLGVWNWGEEAFPKINPNALSVPELAAWEAKVPPSGEFWVATGNFLGDQDPGVRSAMLRNLRNNVRYTYFLQSNPDLRRWMQFRDNLERDSKTGPLKEQMQAFVVELDKSESWQRKLDCFIATSPEGDAEGYKLTREVELNRPITGSRMSPDQIEAVKKVLKRLVPLGSIIGSRHLTPDLFFRGAVVWVHFDYIDLVAQGQLNEEDFAEFLEIYDQDLAPEISKCGGEVVRRSEAGYCIVIADQQDKKALARKWAFELAIKMKALLKIHEQRLEIIGPRYRFLFSYGNLKRTFSTLGFAPTGSPIRECQLKAATFQAGDCVALPSFFLQLFETKSSLLQHMSRRADGSYEVCLD